ncbi:DNA mismatch repair protein MLH1 [Nematocida sp. AWRm80]|nr:DNA mismatch repair protein MLH1 [Nematocida sp. AWRm80]
MTIELLPEKVIEKMSAGEVITSPTALVKEILENSLDSGATEIRIELTESLTDRIRISDNGTGIRKEDLALLCRRHATSKLKEYSDLSTISTLGFRGEALASISSLASVSVRTATKDTSGFLAEYQNTELSHLETLPHPQGTTLTISKLFYNDIPRRDTFNCNKLEHKKIKALIMKYSICYNRVSFELYKGSTLHRYNTTPQSKVDSITSLYSDRLKNELIRIDYTTSTLSILLYATHSNVVLPAPITIMFINRRLVEVSRIKKSISGVYKEVLVKGYPFIYLEIEVPSETIDVNVHPSKTVVCLREEEKIIEAIESKLREILQSNRITGVNQMVRPDNTLENQEERNKQKKDHFQSTVQKEDYHRNQPQKENSIEGSSQSETIQKTQTNNSQANYTTTPTKKVRIDPYLNPLTLFMTSKNNTSSIPSTPTINPTTPTTNPTTTSTNDINPTASTNPTTTTTNPITTSTNPITNSITSIQSEYTPKGITKDDISSREDSLDDCMFIGMASRHWSILQKNTTLLGYNIHSLFLIYLIKYLPWYYTALTISVVIPIGFITESSDNKLYHIEIESNSTNCTLVIIPVPVLINTNRQIVIGTEEFSTFLRDRQDVLSGECTDTLVSNGIVSNLSNDTLVFLSILAEYILLNNSLVVFKELQHCNVLDDLPESTAISCTLIRPAMVLITNTARLYRLFNR